MSALPAAADLFARFFDRWVRPADRERRGAAAVRPDLLTMAAFRGEDAAAITPLTAAAQKGVHDQITRMVAAARVDWKTIVAPYDVLAREGLLRIDAAYDEVAVAELVTSSDPSDFGNSYVVTCCELGAVIGEALRAARPSLVWVADWPYWESALVDRASGEVIPPFHWAIKRFSASGSDEGLVEKIGACLALLARRAAGAPAGGAA